jgi:uncharacterized protein
LSGIFLLDVNVLVAAFWRPQSSHVHVQRWLTQNAGAGWATCPLTQSSFVRLLSNPAFSSDALTVPDAIALLHTNLAHPAHHFWADEIGVSQALEKFSPRLIGHQQVSDAYLLGLAIHKNGRFATRDRGILGLLPEKSPERARVVLI